MIQLEEHLKQKEHDTHMVAKITKKIGEWSVRETAGENAALTQGNLEEKTEGNRGLGAEGNPGRKPSRAHRRRKSRALSVRIRASRARSRRAFGCGCPGTPRQTTESRENQEAGRHAEAATRADQSNAIARLLCQRVWKDSDKYSAPARFLLGGPWCELLLVHTSRHRRPFS